MQVAVILTRFGPSQEFTSFIVLSIELRTAKLVLLPQELVRAKDSEYAEDEDDEEENAHQTWNGGQQRLDLLLDGRHLVH